MNALGHAMVRKAATGARWAAYEFRARGFPGSELCVSCGLPADCARRRVWGCEGFPT